ncbi:hypothetical protein STXM2123_436 [Streptomyces sp. F-3]|uniref:Uncharacterized protein n=1 Tax=Streptomyces thermogriseus TaxID=75292 RepID=A0ABN1STN6_9ACTN|nr:MULTISPECIES: hypothetical protein [Streptomyces]GAT79736.1 hypothetical protein STXM2123_436 [Streptomyces sp. F-3]
MTGHRGGTPGGNGAPVPRDPPDQQVGAGEDPWEVALAPEWTGSDAAGEAADEGEGAADADVPDTDEAGTGRRSASRADTASPDREPSEQPVPDEPSD